MELELKPLHRGAIASALEKAARYRMLNEPMEAESICRDILEIDPANQRALTTLFLALTDRFSRGLSGTFEDAQATLERIAGEYERAYYGGILCERRAKALHRGGALGSGPAAYEWFHRAMECFSRAEALRPENDDDAILRFNTCVRMIQRHPEIRPDDTAPPLMLE